MKNNAQRLIITFTIWYSRTLKPFIGPVWRIWLFFTHLILEQLYLRHGTGLKLGICHLQGRVSIGLLDTQNADIRACTDGIRPRYQSAQFLILRYASIKWPILRSQDTVWKVQRYSWQVLQHSQHFIFSISCLFRGLGCFAFLSTDQLFPSRPHVKYLFKKNASWVIVVTLRHGWLPFACYTFQ